MNVLYSAKKNWVHYLSRPFDLFGASVWHAWYASARTKEIFSATMPNVLFVEEHPGVMRQYRIRSEWNRFDRVIEETVLQKPARCQKLLEQGMKLNLRAKRILRKGPSSFSTLEQSIDFLIELALCATVLPFRSYRYYVQNSAENTRLLKLSEALRARSYYPEIFIKIVVPLARLRLRNQEKTFGKNILHVVTLQELLSGKILYLHGRVRAYKEKKRVVYQNLSGTETISWVKDIVPVLAELEHRPHPKRGNNFILHGQSAFPGVVRGKARIVLQADPTGIVFRKGEILITLNSTPALMPLLRKCGAIVSDEGGLSCHAAIVARELKKPCVMGTKTATSLLRDGDDIEVDANNGIVKKLSFLKQPR